MAAFDPDTDLGQDRAYRLLINTPVTLFWRLQVLDETTAWLRAHGYQVTGLDASRWSAEDDLHRDIAAALSFPDYYGRNLDALNDCVRDVVSQDYGWAPGTTGLAVVLAGYDAFAARCPRGADRARHHRWPLAWCRPYWSPPHVPGAEQRSAYWLRAGRHDARHLERRVARL